VPSRGASSERLTFPPRRRLRRKSEYDAAYARGRRFADAYFAVVARANGLGCARLGLAIATKAAGNSVERNRVRRVIREAFRLRQHDLPAVDLVVSARGAVAGAENAVLHASLETLWDKVTQQCASSP
jgi:ribonuclease P protein component